MLFMMNTYFSSLIASCPGFIGPGEWHLDNLSALTVLFGKNGSGKSVLLRAVRDARQDVAHYVVPERTGDLGFDAGMLQQQISSKQRRDVSGRNFLSDYRRQIIARIQAYFLTRGAVRVRELMPVPPDELEVLLVQLIPDFAIELQGSNPPYRLRRASSEDEVGNVDQLSSGEAQVLTL